MVAEMTGRKGRFVRVHDEDTADGAEGSDDEQDEGIGCGHGPWGGG